MRRFSMRFPRSLYLEELTLVDKAKVSSLKTTAMQKTHVEMGCRYLA